MDIEVANKIKTDFGKFLELAGGNLLLMFLSKIPESLLPYSKEIISEALTTLIKHFENLGDVEAVKTIESAVSYLDFYVPDQDALEAFNLRFDKKYLESILPILKRQQEEQFLHILDTNKQHTTA